MPPLVWLHFIASVYLTKWRCKAVTSCLLLTWCSVSGMRRMWSFLRNQPIHSFFFLYLMPASVECSFSKDSLRITFVRWEGRLDDESEWGFLEFLFKSWKEKEVCTHSEHGLQEVVLDLQVFLVPQMNRNPGCGTDIVKTVLSFSGFVQYSFAEVFFAVYCVASSPMRPAGEKEWKINVM